MSPNPIVRKGKKKNSMKNKLTPIFGLTVAIGLALLSCGSNTNPTDPLAQFQPQISNSPDDFQFQATAIENVSATVNYSWSNTGSQGTVNHSSTVDSGTATLYIYDANDTLVYSNGLAASLNEPTQSGLTGNWRVRVVLTNCYGTLNFRVQKL
jgi:hypothetical protein